MTPLAPSLAFPQAQQKRNYPDALRRWCPVCFADPTEPCRPASLSIPHLARCRAGDQGPRSAA